MKHVDVIERLQRIRQFYRDTIEDYTAVEAVDMAIEAVEKQEADRWIPVTERLPEYGTTVLTQLSDNDIVVNWVTDEEDEECLNMALLHGNRSLNPTRRKKHDTDMQKLLIVG